MTVGGVALTELPLDELRGRVALVTQEHHVFVGSLADNLRLARPSASDEDLLAALHSVDASGWVAALARRVARRRRRRGCRVDARAGPAGGARPAGARRSPHAGARRGDLADRPPLGAAPGEVAVRGAARGAPSSPSRTGCTPRTTPTGSRSSRTGGSSSSGRTTSSSRPTEPTRRCGGRGRRSPSSFRRAGSWECGVAFPHESIHRFRRAYRHPEVVARC